MLAQCGIQMTGKTIFSIKNYRSMHHDEPLGRQGPTTTVEIRCIDIILASSCQAKKVRARRLLQGEGIPTFGGIDGKKIIGYGRIVYL